MITQKKIIIPIFDYKLTIVIFDKWKELNEFLPSEAHADVYVAINAQYHDYCELFKSWFNDGIEQKIIESAVVFWFKDDDYKDGFKLWNYFKED
jgi:hypothetical protein